MYKLYLNILKTNEYRISIDKKMFYLVFKKFEIKYNKNEIKKKSRRKI